MQYSALTESQKEQARQWWWDLEKECPAWECEHQLSRSEAINAYHQGITSEVATKFARAEVTGYCADCLLADLWEIHREAITLYHIRKYYDASWQREMRSRNNRKYIEDCIEANEYEFKITETVELA